MTVIFSSSMPGRTWPTPKRERLIYGSTKPPSLFLFYLKTTLVTSKPPALEELSGAGKIHFRSPRGGDKTPSGLALQSFARIPWSGCTISFPSEWFYSFFYLLQRKSADNLLLFKAGGPSWEAELELLAAINFKHQDQLVRVPFLEF